MGALAGQLIQFNTTGVDSFAMTALFVVLAVEQWLSAKSHIPAIVGLVCGVVAVIVLGPENFIIPALLVAVVLLLVLQGRSEMEMIFELYGVHTHHCRCRGHILHQAGALGSSKNGWSCRIVKRLGEILSGQS